MDLNVPFWVACALFVVFCLMPKRPFWQFAMRQMGWSVKGELPDTTHCIFACFPHTSGWDLFYGLFLVFSTPGAKVMMKSELSWMRFLGLPVLAVTRGKGDNQSEAIAGIFRKLDCCWLWLWISGTRKKTDHISSGFYFIAREAKVPIIFGALDYRTKQMVCSELYDAEVLTKDEILEKARAFSKQHDLKGAGYVPGNYSELNWREKKKTK